MKGPMTSSTLPDIDRDRLEGFRKMAHAVIDDAVEAGITLAARNERTIVALEQQVAADHEAEAAAVLELNHATGGSALNLTAAVEDAVELIATLRHRIDEAQKQMSAIAAEAIAAEAGAAQLAAIPVEQGPFIITMKVPQGRRFWATWPSVEAGGWQVNVDAATTYPTRALAEAAKPRRSAVVTLADARELIEAEKVVSITPPADAPTGPEAA